MHPTLLAPLFEDAMSDAALREDSTHRESEEDMDATCTGPWLFREAKGHMNHHRQPPPHTLPLCTVAGLRWVSDTPRCPKGAFSHSARTARARRQLLRCFSR